MTMMTRKPMSSADKRAQLRAGLAGLKPVVTIAIDEM
jgi:hypothetical protein